MRIIKYFIFIIILLSSCKQPLSKTIAYNIEGSIKGKSDNTIIFLNIENTHLDSTYIKNGKFQFTGKTNKINLASIYTKDKTEHAIFWIENCDIKIVCEDSSLNESTIYGSKSQEIFNSLNKKLKSTRIKIDSIQTHAKQVQISELALNELQREYDELEKNEKEINKQFIKDNKESLMSLYILNIYKDSWEIDTTINLFNSLKHKESSFAKEIDIFIKSQRNPQVGDKFINFDLEDHRGAKYNTSNIKDKYILIDFWASWCSSCRALNPTIKGEYEKYRTLGLEIVGISLDKNKERWKKAIVDDEIQWLNFCDFKGNKSEAVLIYNINNIPNNILVDKNGIIIARKLSPNELKLKLEEIFSKENKIY